MSRKVMQASTGLEAATKRTDGWEVTAVGHPHSGPEILQHLAQHLCASVTHHSEPLSPRLASTQSDCSDTAGPSNTCTSIY